MRHGGRCQGGRSIEVGRITRLRDQIYSLPRCHGLDRRAIGSPLHHAILILLHGSDGVGEPDADTDKKRNDDDGNDIHQHTMRIIVVLVVLFISREIVDWLVVMIVRRGRCDASGLLCCAVALPEKQHLPGTPSLGFIRIWSVGHHVGTTMPDVFTTAYKWMESR